MRKHRDATGVSTNWAARTKRRIHEILAGLDSRTGGNPNLPGDTEGVSGNGSGDSPAYTDEHSLDPGGATKITPGIPALVPVVVRGHDAEGTFRLEFSAYAISCEIVDNQTVITKFSNGVVLTQKVQP